MEELEKKELDKFIETWSETATQTKQAFSRLKAYLEGQNAAVLSFKARPGVSFSLRAVRPGQTGDLYVMVDVIDDEPDQRWLSVCFYGDMISDPDEEGDLIPGGLLGEDGYCFDVDEGQDSLLTYLEVRLDEAYQAASS